MNSATNWIRKFTNGSWHNAEKIFRSQDLFYKSEPDKSGKNLVERLLAISKLATVGCRTFVYATPCSIESSAANQQRLIQELLKNGKHGFHSSSTNTNPMTSIRDAPIPVRADLESENRTNSKNRKIEPVWNQNRGNRNR